MTFLSAVFFCPVIDRIPQQISSSPPGSKVSSLQLVATRTSCSPSSLNVIAVTETSFSNSHFRNHSDPNDCNAGNYHYHPLPYIYIYLYGYSQQPAVHLRIISPKPARDEQCSRLLSESNLPGVQQLEAQVQSETQRDL